MRRALATGIAALTLAACAAAGSAQRPVTIAPPAADVAAVEQAIDAVYAVISGPVGQPRDFERMRTFFTPDARMTAITPQGLRGGTVEDYIARSGKFLVAQGFTERELANRIDIYGDLAHVWSSYEGRFTGENGAPGSVRGINSFQLVRQADGRWLVQSIFWQAETPATPLPADMTGAR